MRKTQNDTVFTTDGEVRKVFPENGTGYELKELYKHIDCTCAQFINLHNGYIMVVDDEGKLTDKEPNPLATYFARVTRAISPNDYIVGSALVCRRERLE